MDEPKANILHVPAGRTVWAGGPPPSVVTSFPPSQPQKDTGVGQTLPTLPRKSNWVDLLIPAPGVPGPGSRSVLSLWTAPNTTPQDWTYIPMRTPAWQPALKPQPPPTAGRRGFFTPNVQPLSPPAGSPRCLLPAAEK